MATSASFKSVLGIDFQIGSGHFTSPVIITQPDHFEQKVAPPPPPPLTVVPQSPLDAMIAPPPSAAMVPPPALIRFN